MLYIFQWLTFSFNVFHIDEFMIEDHINGHTWLGRDLFKQPNQNTVWSIYNEVILQKLCLRVDQCQRNLPSILHCGSSCAFQSCMDSTIQLPIIRQYSSCSADRLKELKVNRHNYCKISCNKTNSNLNLIFQFDFLI